MTSASSDKTAKRKKRALPNQVAVAPSFKSFLSLDRRTVIFSLALIAAVLAFYSPVTHNGFLDYDDNGYITDNPHVKAGLTWKTVKWAFLTNTAANWHPLTWISHALDTELFGVNPAATHWMNVLLHAACAVVLFWLLRSATGSRWRSLIVAALFALHPINVESVAWAAERKNVLSMLFFLLALYAYVWYARQPAPGRYAAVAGFFALALLAKPQVITFPFLLLLFDYWPLDRLETQPRKPDANPRAANVPQFRIQRLLWEKTPLLLLSAASAIITMKAQASGGAVKDLARYSLLSRLETAAVSYVRYLGKALWPAKLLAPYPHPAALYPAWQAGGAALLLLLITALVCARLRQQGYLAMGWFWFLGSLVPMIGLVQVGEQAMADRYAYLPFIGLFVMLVWLLADCATALRIPSRWLAVPAVSCLLALGILTYRQVGYWHDTESFWRRALALTQDNYLAHEGLGGFLQEQGRTEEAIAEVRAALAIRPENLRDNLNLGVYEHSRNHLEAAIEQYQLVAQRATDADLRAKAYSDLGAAYYQMGDATKARQSIETSLQLEPNQPMLLVRLGLIAQKNGDLPEAVRQYSQAAALQHSDVYALLLAQALQLQGHRDAASAIFNRVARRSPNLAEAQKAAEALLSEK